LFAELPFFELFAQKAATSKAMLKRKNLIFGVYKLYSLLMILNRSFVLLLISICMTFPGSLLKAQESRKKVMDHSIYEDWNSLQGIKISNDGQWAAYEVKPNKGDGVLHLVNLEDRSGKTFDRGTKPQFSPESDYLVFSIKAPYALTRKTKLDKKKKENMPKDSLGIYRLNQDLLSKVPRVEKFSVPDRASSWFVLKHYYKKDTTAVDTNDNGVKLARPEGKPSKMVVMNPLTNQKHEFEKVYDYSMAEEGTAVVFTRFSIIDDTIAGRSICYLETLKGSNKVLFRSGGSFGKMNLDRTGNQLAFLHHPDTGKIVGMNMHYWSSIQEESRIILDTLSEGMPEQWGISNNMDLSFSGDGSRLYFGTAPLQEKEPEDSLLDDEKYRVDIWNWQDGLLQPMQMKQIEKERKRSYVAVWQSRNGGMIQLADKNMEDINTMYKGNGYVALGSSSKPYHKLISWKASLFKDFYLVDTKTGNRELILKEKAFGASLSPAGKYIVWYEGGDSNYYSHGVESGELTCLTCGIKADFHNVKHDAPSPPRPYGIAGFTADDGAVLIYSQFDIWKLDPDGIKLPVNLTSVGGSEKKISFRYRHLEYDDPFIPLDKAIFLTGINERTKETGIYSASALLSMEPLVLAEGKFNYQLVSRARNADVLCWRKGDFDDYPDVYVSDSEFKELQRISDANPQSEDYYWGSPRLVHWTSYSGDKLDGILVVPENFDPSEKYPMLVYFYEKSSDRLYRHVSPRPSRSTISWPWCASNGYVVFVPDINYRDGHPGQSAYDAIVSGTLSMCEQFDFIDRDHMGLQGQSWGGYQVAWLVTRTNLYKAAMAGAPVSNMTSAYGGIRWETGLSRMFQYEESQSRIGGTLWDKTDLYLENSPIFAVPDIQTPLLIMHNDNDGSVPWYQGIELFVALRRLDKPAWMLVYNNEEHNLKKWPNRVDLSIRMMQFFDHYLKDAPAPAWMSEGIPAIKKGKTDGYEFIKTETEN